MSDPATRPLYKILEGVHRCVAAHLAGQATITARVDVKGSLGPPVPVPLDDIYSPKPVIDRWDHDKDFHVLLNLMADDEGRASIPAVELVAIPRRVAKYLTPVARVTVTG